jgi:hypothetical protein
VLKKSVKMLLKLLTLGGFKNEVLAAKLSTSVTGLSKVVRDAVFGAAGENKDIHLAIITLNEWRNTVCTRRVFYTVERLSGARHIQASCSLESLASVINFEK